MKVNIKGKGVIPGVNCLAPVYNRDLSEPQIRRILNYRQFAVYNANTTELITKTNIARMFDNLRNQNNSAFSVPVVAEVATTGTETVEVPKVIPVEEPVVNEEVINTPTVEDHISIDTEVNEEIDIDDTDTDVTDEEEEDVTTEEKQVYGTNSFPSKKNKKKKK